MLVSWMVVAGVIGFALEAAAHGLVTNCTVDGIFYKGYWDKHHPWVQDNSPGREWDMPGIGVNVTGFDKAPIYDSEFKSPDFICHRGVTPGRSSWNPLEKVGLINPTIQNYPGETFQAGYWTADKLIDDHNSWTLKIPAGIAPGNYTLRHEIIALHATYGGANPNPTTPYGGQFYPNCFNLDMTGTGIDPLASGTLGNDLYSISELGLARKLWIFDKDFKNYTIPGPAVYTPNGAGSSTGNEITSLKSSVASDLTGVSRISIT